MSQMGPRDTGVSARVPRYSNNVYTVLALVAVIALLIGVIFVWVSGNKLFGTSNPFEVIGGDDRLGSTVIWARSSQA